MTPELETLIRKALQFCDLAAGEGLCFPDQGLDPADFLFEYWDKIDRPGSEFLIESVIAQLNELAEKAWMYDEVSK